MNYQDIADLSKFCNIKESDFIDSSLPKVRAFVSPHEAGEVLNSYPNYSHEVKTLIKRLGVAAKDIQFSSEFIMEILVHLYDEEKIENIFGISLNKSKNFFRINFESFKSILKFISNNSLGNFIKSNTKDYIKIFDELKILVISSIFTEEKLKYLLKYVCLFEVMLESLKTFQVLNCFFIRDFLFFNLKLLSQKKNCYILKKSVLSVLWFFFDDFLNYGAEVLKDYLSQITRILISTAESVNESDLQEICLKLLKKLICENYELLGNSIGKIDSFPSTSNYKDLRDIHKKYQNLECSNGLRGDIENLLRDSKRGAEGLKVFKNNVSIFCFL